MSTVNVEGVHLFVLDIGAGPAVVLVPGLGLSSEVWDRQVRLLSASHRVVCVDPRGHGRSDKPADGYEVHRLALDLAAVLDELRTGACAVVGWSFGGQVAFHLAAIRPDLVERLVLVGTNAVRASRGPDYPFGPRPGAYERVLVEAEERDRILGRRAAIAAGFSRPVDPHVLDHLVACSLQMPSWSAIACYRAMVHTDLRDDIDKIAVPVLQIRGSADPVHSAGAVAWLDLRLADARSVELTGCGHYPMIEAPEEFDRALVSFIDAAAR